MIIANVETTLMFNTLLDFRRYLSDPILPVVSGFRTELEHAQLSGLPIICRRPCPDYAACCNTVIKVEEI